MTGRRRFLPLLALVMLSLYWGYSWVWSKLALMDAGQFTFSACRMLVAAASLLLALPLLPLLPLLFLLRRPLRPDTLLELVLLGLVGLSGLIGLSMWAPVEGGVGTPSILVLGMPFWTPLLAWPVLGERVQESHRLAVALASAGFYGILNPFVHHESLLSK